MKEPGPLEHRIADDILSAAPFKRYSTQVPPGLDGAYRVQDALAERLRTCASHGAIAGWKIAANSPALLEKFHLEEPVSGRIFANQRQDSGVKLPASGYLEFAFEPEIAAVMGRTLAPQDAPFQADAVASAIERFAPSAELLDMRKADLSTVQMTEAVAQNISNAGAVIGGPGIAADALDPASVRTVLTVDGLKVHDVTGGAPQHPLEAVTWLANHLSLRGLSLEKGQTVLCGTHSPIWYHAGPGEIDIEMSGLGSVSFSLE